MRRQLAKWARSHSHHTRLVDWPLTKCIFPLKFCAYQNLWGRLVYQKLWAGVLLCKDKVYQRNSSVCLSECLLFVSSVKSFPYKSVFFFFFCYIFLCYEFALVCRFVYYFGLPYKGRQTAKWASLFVSASVSLVEMEQCLTDTDTIIWILGISLANSHRETCRHSCSVQHRIYP